MSQQTIGIIGTAGRGSDGNILTKAHFERMTNAALILMNHLNINPETARIVSGGAAWADHVAVNLCKIEACNYNNLVLYTPLPISMSLFIPSNEGIFGDNGQPVRLDPNAAKTADTANYYHQKFSQALTCDTIGDIAYAGASGAMIIPGNGNFFARNTALAKDVTAYGGLLLAYTFGSDGSTQADWSGNPYPDHETSLTAPLKDGGTLHTWKTAKCAKFHVKIGNVA